MNSKDYVNGYNFGYGNTPEQRFLNKLLLRNIEDVKEYICGVIENAFVADFENLFIKFLDNMTVI